MIERWLLVKVDIQDLPKDNLDKHCFEEYIKGWLIVNVDSAAVSIFVYVLIELTDTVFDNSTNAMLRRQRYLSQD